MSSIQDFNLNLTAKMNSSTLSSNYVSFNSSQSQLHQCSHLQLYKKTYNELSTIRIEFKASQQQTEVLRNTVKGLEQENKYLKGFLGSKKEIISKLNYEISFCNQEINRLEEDSNREKEAKFIIEQKYNAIRNKEQQAQKLISQLKAQSCIIKEKLQVTELELKYKQKSLSQNKELQVKTQTIKNACRILEGSLEGFNSEISPQFNQKTYSLNIKLQGGDQNMKQFYAKCNKLVQNHKYKIEQCQSQSIMQKGQISNLNANIKKLQNELALERAKLTEQKSKTTALSIDLGRKQRESQEFTSKFSTENQNKEKFLLRLINQLTQALKKYFGGQDPAIFQKIIDLANKNDPQMFEFDVLIGELWNLANLRYALTLKYELQNKQMEKVNEKYLQLQQEYELLTLNHGILSRQYRQLLQDNRRLIKYNNISQFRLRRNVTNQNALQTQLVLEKDTKKQQKSESFKTHRKDFQQKIGNRTRESHGNGKENDYLACNY